VGGAILQKKKVIKKYFREGGESERGGTRPFFWSPEWGLHSWKGTESEIKGKHIIFPKEERKGTYWHILTPDDSELKQTKEKKKG